MPSAAQHLYRFVASTLMTGGGQDAALGMTTFLPAAIKVI